MKRKRRALHRFILKKRPYCEMPSRTFAPTCLNTATDIIYIRGRGELAVCRECKELL